jgi:spore germination protein KC
MKRITQVRKHKIIFMFLIIIPLLSGCWDRLELEERATVLGIAIDSLEKESEKQGESVTHFEGEFPEKDIIKLTVQFAVPGRLPLGPGQGGGGGGAGPENSVWIIEVTGKTIDDAFSKLQQQIEFRVFLGHLRIIVVSEALAKDGLKEMSDYLKRNSEVRRAAWLAVSKGDPAKIIKATPELERVPTLYIMGTLDESVRLGRFPNDFLGIYWSKLSSKGQEAFLPYIDLLEKGNIEIKGLAYFKEDKMVGKTRPLEIGYFMAIMGMNPGGYKALTYIPGTDDTVMAKSVKRTSKIDVKIKNGVPNVNVKVHLEMDISEKNAENWDLSESRQLKKLNDEISKNAEKGFLDFIKMTQEKGSDIFGFGEHVRAKESDYWNREIQTAEKWQKMYTDIPVSVEVKIDIRRVGMKAK